jgi:DNA sulfur modification protein DndC
VSRISKKETGSPAGSVTATILAEIQAVYRADTRPWVIGYSGGKDSTCALQLIWHAIAGLPASERLKPIHVIAGDTLVETPAIVDYLGATLARISIAAAEQGLPIQAHKVSPQVDETFWVNVIGRGYPAPTSRFRWCTERMKIKPANRFIRERVAEHGEVIVVLGVRHQESATRAQVMSLRAIKNSLLSRHSTLPNAFVYTPIRDFSLDDVWTYLLQVSCPWGNDNHDLLAMYQRSSSDECPLVVDDTTPSCGSSRFGCWVCTVVTKDKAMEAMIDKGDEWLEPLLKVRDSLAATQDPAVKAVVRGHVRKNGRVSAKTKGDTETDRVVRGPYLLSFCQDLLRKVLEAEASAQAAAPEGQQVELISDEELHNIRRIWIFERSDWADSLPEIVRNASDRRITWRAEDTVTFASEDEQVLADLCDEADLPLGLLKSLIDCERELQGLKRRAGIRAGLHRVLGYEWRDEAEVIAEIIEAEQDAEALAVAR